jgi:GntR family transcriptional regulator
VREIRYRRIADALRAQVVDGAYGPGMVLPSEAELAREHEASRVTIRKALEVLKDDGLIDSRQGFGWFVRPETLRQSLTEVATIDQQLAAVGRTATRQVLSFGFVSTPPRVRSVLDADEVLEVVRRSLADHQPFDLVEIWVPAHLASGVSRDDVESASFYDLLDVSFGRASQAIGAAVASDTEGGYLEVPEGSPLLVVERVAMDEDGAPVLVATHRFPAHLTEFVVEVPFPNRDYTPAGLRLVGE